MATRSKPATRSTRSRSSSSTRSRSRSRSRVAPASEQVAVQAARVALDEFATSTGATGLRTIVREAVTDTLERLGIDTKHPDETRADMHHLRTWRELTTNMRQQGFGEATKWFVRAAIAALMVGIGVMISRGTAG